MILKNQSKKSWRTGYTAREVIKMTEFKNDVELLNTAISLYDGGWRATDRDQIKSEYDFKYDSDLDAICEILLRLESENK